MANNIQFITSITRQTDFEDIVRRIVKVIYDADAYLVGGPYDSGLDLVYKRAGTEAKEAIQITIQEKNIENKVLEDAKKTRLLVDEHQYPERLTLFWSRTMSNRKKLDLKKLVRSETGIELEIYDATQIDQIITEDEPSILTYLLSVVHKIDISKTTNIDPKDRAFYDYLALGRDTANLKNSIIDAQIISRLLNSPLSKEKLVAQLDSSGVRRGVTSARANALAKAGRIHIVDEEISLTENEHSRITNILAKDEAERLDLLSRLSTYSIEKIGEDISKEALEIIIDVYRASSVDIQMSEIIFEPPRMAIAKSLVNKLEALIQSKGEIENVTAHRLAKELLKIGAENNYLSNQCSSLLCIQLLSQRKLEKYIQGKIFFIYLDATVYIRYLALYGFNKPEYFDAEMNITADLRESIKNLPAYKVAVTRDHLEETVRHITQAEKISRFASDDILSKFGESKNVYFNLYARERRRLSNFSFDDFLEKLIGYERSNAAGYTNFNAYMACIQRFNGIAQIEVPECQNIEHDQTAKRISSRYETWAAQIGKSRKHRTAFNDVAAAYIMSDENRNRDSNGYGHTPIFVTWDSTQHNLRQIFREEFPHAEWFVYSPQRAIERFSMLDFSVDAKAIKDSVLAIIDEDYTKDSSLIDALAGIFGEDKVEADAIISVLAKLSGRLHGETSESSHFEAEEKTTIAEALLSIEYEFRNVFDEVRKSFATPENQDRIVNMLSNYLSGSLKMDGLNQQVKILIDELRVKTHGTNA